MFESWQAPPFSHIRSLVNLFAHRYAALRVGVKGKTPVGKTNPSCPWHGVKMPKDFPPPGDDLPQSEAKLYLPPNCFIWRSNTAGARAP